MANLFLHKRYKNMNMCAINSRIIANYSIRTNFSKKSLPVTKHDYSKNNLPINQVTLINFCGICDKKSTVDIIDKKTGEKVETTLVHHNYNGLCFNDEIKIGTKKLGYIKTNPKTTPSPGMPKSYNNGFLYVDLLKNCEKEKYGQIGTQLIKNAVRKSDELGFDGRIALEAALSSHVFYYKLGFRPFGNSIEVKYNTAEIKRAIEEEKRTGEIQNTNYLGFVPMYLPDEKIEKFLS